MKEVDMEKGGARVSVPEDRVGNYSRRGWKVVKAVIEKTATEATEAEKVG